MNKNTEPKPTTEHGGNQAGSAQITIVEGSAKGSRYRLAAKTTFGRSPEANVVLPDAGVSRLHALVTRLESGAFLIEDLESRNGTFVNGKRITRQPLALGDKVRLGPQTAFEFHGFDPIEDHIVQRQHFEALGRLSVAVAHDLNNVLATFEAATTYLQQISPNKALSDSDVVECIGDLSMGAQRAGNLARKILSFARGTGTRRGVVNLSELVIEIVRMLRYTFPRNIHIEVQANQPVCVLGARSELEQVLLNLCFNSRDAMPDGGLLKITTHVDPTPPAELGFGEGKGMAVLSVSDTGSGMDTATQASVFDLFYTTKRGGMGYGLGLATVREIITLHDGGISLQSALGRGTKFTVQLPLNPEEASDSAAVSEPYGTVTLVPQGFHSILLVDDDPVVRRAIARRLRQTGFEVDEAADGLQALQLCQMRGYHLIVLDLDMPELDGLDTYHRLIEIDPASRVVFATGYANPERASLVRAAGALGLLEKPYRIEALVKYAQDICSPEQPTQVELEVPSQS